jgi:hypothetical protein
MSPTTRNWITAALAITLLFVLAVTLAGLSGEPKSDSFLERPSTFFTDSSGARALFLVTKKLLPSVQQWRRPLSLLPIAEDPRSASTLIVADPRRHLSKTEAEHLDRWLAKGGQLILATSNGWPLSDSNRGGEPELERTSADKSERELTPAVKKPTYLSTHGAKLVWSKRGEPRNLRITGAALPEGGLDVRSSQSFFSVNGAQVIAAAGDAALAVAISLGKGRIVAIADPAIVSNQALREADNAVWLVTLVAGWGNQGVLFDEYHHGFGQRRSAGDLTWAFLQTPWGWCVSQVALAALLYVFGYRRRFGRLSEPPPIDRASPLDLVKARGGFLQAAAAQGLAAELIAQNFCHEWAKVCGRPVDLSTLRNGEGFPGRINDSDHQLNSFRALVSKVERREGLSDREFIEIGRIAGRMITEQHHEC